MVSYKIKHRHTKLRRQTKRNTKKTNAKTRKNRMIGGRYGQKVYDDGKIYDGQIWPEINKPHGNGMMTWNNGDQQYIGQWSYGKMNGKGTMLWNTGTSYTGNWRNNKRHGNGSLIYPDGKVVEGKWDRDNPIGKFIVSWPNADPILHRTTTIDAAEVEDFGAGDDDSDRDTI
jgi:hypothetical protein